MTTVVNFYAGPGTGKSTSAAYVFAKLKMAGVNAELVREHAKDWAWAGRQIRPEDQVGVYLEQSNREALLYGKVDVVVTDSPLLLTYYFATKFAPAHAEIIRDAALAMRSYTHPVDIFLHRSKAYNPAGRYQTAEEAQAMDMEIQRFVGRFVSLRHEDTRSESLDQVVEAICQSV